MERKIKTIATYGGHSVNSAKSVNLTLKFTYDTITKYIQTIQMLNENVMLIAVIDGQKCKLGSFMVNNINIDHDGAGKIKFNSQVDFVEMDSISKLVGSETFRIMMKADIDIDEEEVNEEVNESNEEEESEEESE